MRKSGFVALVLWVVVTVSLTGVNAFAEEPNALAERILQAVDRPVGLAHLPRCGRGELALALAEAGDGLYVHGQDADAADVAGAREAADLHGLLNHRLSIDQGGLDRLLPVGISCDLVVMTDMTRTDLTPALASEIRRVLHPWYGVAVLGNVSRKLDSRGLLDWAKGIAPEVSLLKGAGTVVKVKAEPLAGADNWSHYWHGPDNNAVSTDTAYSYPETIQWTGKPFNASRTDLPIVANGRLFMLWNSNLVAHSPKGEAVLPGEQVALMMRGGKPRWEGPLGEQRGPLLVARATGSGVRLWHRRLSPATWLQAQRSIVVAEGNRLLVADGSTLLELEQATGAERRRVKLDCDEIKWIAATDTHIAILGGAPFNRSPKTMGKKTKEHNTRFRSLGSLLTVLDSATLRPLWSEQREQGSQFDPRTPAISGDRLFVLGMDGIAEAYDLETGATAWSTETGIEHDQEVGYLWHRVLRHPVAGYAVGDLYIVGAPEMDRCAVLSQDDGQPMWELARGRRPWAPVPLGYMDLVWLERGRAVDPVTGETKRNEPVDLGGCGHCTAAPQGIIGMTGLTWDAVRDVSVPPVHSKSACASGQFVANGLIWRIPSGVGHIPEYRGFNVRGPVEKGLPSAGPRLVRTYEIAQTTADATDWISYRGNVKRTGSVAAEIPADASLLWRSDVAGGVVQDVPPGGVLVGPRLMPAPPVMGEGKLVFAINDGTVQALDLATGNPLWRAHTGGRIQSSPMIWKERVFVGCADGCLYAFALADGRQLWRLRVAPQAGRMMFFGQLGSRWPVLASPMVVDGRVFAVAGYMDRIDGVWAIAADAVSGEIVWQRGDWRSPTGEPLSPNGMLGGTGQLAWDDAAAEAVYNGGEGFPIRLSPEDGTARLAYADGKIAELREEHRGVFLGRHLFKMHELTGQDMGKFSDIWLVRGGTGMLTDIPDRIARHKEGNFVAQRGQGDGLLPILVVPAFGLMPSWDDSDVLFAFGERRKPTRLGPRFALAPKGKIEAFLQGRLAVDEEEPAGVNLNIELDRDDLVTWRLQFRYGEITPVGSALAGNAALVLFKNRSDGESKVIALDRTDGSELWQVGLPATPIFNGLTLAPDGRVIVTLRDGSVLCLGKKEESRR